MPIPATSLVNIECVMNGVSAAGGSTNRLWAFVFHFRRTATIGPASKTAFETAFQANIAIPICAALNASYAQSNNAIRWLNDALDAPMFVTRAVAGSITGDRMMTADSSYILFRTGLRGKSYRGSKHLGPMSESDSTAGTDDIWNAGALTRLGAVALAVLTGFTDSGGNVWVPSVVSRKLSQMVTNPTIIVANDITAAAVNKRIGTMRHRKVRSVY
jgi:hypothetical protein